MYKAHLNLWSEVGVTTEEDDKKKKNAKKITIWFYYNDFTSQYEIMHSEDLFRHVVAVVKGQKNTL